MIAQTAGILAFTAMVTGHSITLMNMHEKEFGSILPVFEFGFLPSLLGAAMLCSIWVEALFLLLVPLKDPGERGLLGFWITGISLNVLMMLSTTTGTIMIFGMGQADNFTHPALETLRILTLGFIDRFDVYGLFLMSFGCFIRTSFYLRLSYDLIAPRFLKGKQLERGALWTCGLAAGLLGWYIARDRSLFEHYTLYYTYFIFLFPLPFLLMLMSWIRTTGRNIQRGNFN